MFKTPKIVAIITLAIIIALAFAAGCLFSPNQQEDIVPGLDVVAEAWDIISTRYVDKTVFDSENMTRAAIEAVIGTLNDRHSAFLSKSELNDFATSMQGQYAGTGAVVSVRDGNIVIVDTIAGSPAEKAGIKAGDILLAVDGEPVTGLSLDAAVSKILGPEGTVVRLLIQKSGASQPVEIDITRAIVELPSVEYELRGDIACIYISQFTERTDSELAPIIKQLKQDGAKGIVLDLRSDGGGLFDIAIRVASHFIPQGVIVKARSRDGTVEVYEAVAGLETTDLPVVALVDENTASSSEVVVGALQDYNRAVIAGNVTYGKGSFNTTFTLSDGTGIYLTIGRWLTPNDRLIEGQGIVPDFKLDITGEKELQWAIDFLHQNSTV
jgi:carboxyl-terminal processing protease